MKVTRGIAVFIALVAPAAAWMFDEKEAAEGEEHPAGLTREQVDSMMSKLFNIIDENKDGKIAIAELEKFNSKNLQRVQNMQLEQEMQMIDRNKDGFIDFEELSMTFPPDVDTPENFHEGLNRRFNIADKDGDTKLTRDELHSLLNPAHDAEMLELEVREIMLTHDKNGDGLISVDEYAASKPEEERVEEFIENDFKPFDLNNDGLLSVQELVAAFKEEASEDVETNIEDVHAIIGEGPVDYATWMKHAVELSTSSITDHGELLRYPSDYGIDMGEDVRERKSQEAIHDYPNTEL
ncbi:endoplasmic reticulum-resident calcium binding protein, putative [Babesia caballi]|uniref:Endoplasmic reticulum-resident calcium binding protein, putative n=1 Tax=Babesia caballi TaxID=5871 RepID=A0AAV4LMC0_BABCB|nr:endoplasmic reticulum-resident calcium binding protein, putative [Babesia caballi]